MWNTSKIVAFQSEEASYHYENFAPNEPNDSNRDEDCVVKRMDRQGEWMDIPCNTYNRWTLCEAAGMLFYDESVIGTIDNYILQNVKILEYFPEITSGGPRTICLTAPLQSTTC